MEIQELKSRSEAIRARYHELELAHHSSEWSIEEDLLAGRLEVDIETELEQFLAEKEKL